MTTSRQMVYLTRTKSDGAIHTHVATECSVRAERRLGCWLWSDQLFWMVAKACLRLEALCIANPV